MSAESCQFLPARAFSIQRQKIHARKADAKKVKEERMKCEGD